MPARRKIIIDTDPGVDDILAILLALAATDDEIEILLLSLTYGNVEVDKCLRNVVHLFHHVHQEILWRKAKGLPVGFGALLASKPLVAIGAEKPLADDILMADYFHGFDGLGNIAVTHPHLSIEDTWTSLFDSKDDAAVRAELTDSDRLFRPSKRPAHEEMLRILAEHAPGEVTIVAVGPMTNTALAAAHGTETFLRVKEVVVMGGAIHAQGNITPVAEFNTFADAYAAARVYALSSPLPHSTMPPAPPKRPSDPTTGPPPFLSAYPSSLPSRLAVTLVPLDITSKHVLLRPTFDATLSPLLAADSPLATWVSAFVTSTFSKIESLRPGTDPATVGLELHDPLCIWYCLRGHEPAWRLARGQDIRVETAGQWTRGMNVVDARARRRRSDAGDDERPGDSGNWLGARAGNRLDRLVATPGGDVFAAELLGRVFADLSGGEH